jgi:thymidylate synthase
MNNLDKQYTDLLKTILEHGVVKKDRTGTGTQSIFGYTIRHNMKDGFPLLTTKKMPFKTIVTELLWFLRGDTNIKFLVDNNCHIWDGDAYKNYSREHFKEWEVGMEYESKESFINRIKTDDEFANKWGELGPVYGKQWRNWRHHYPKTYPEINQYEQYIGVKTIDQIQNLINGLKTNPDSRRLMVNAWNVGELDQMVLPPCHYGFQVYTRELSHDERFEIYKNSNIGGRVLQNHITAINFKQFHFDEANIPTRAISLMWNQRSVDTFLGLPFNIASYGLLLEIIAEIVNMVPDQLIGNLGDTHLYLNHLDQAREQIGREQIGREITENEILEHLQQSGMDALRKEPRMEYISKLPKRTREPYPLPKLSINTEFWNPGTDYGCGMGPGTYTDDINALIRGMEIQDFQIEGYESHPTIKAPLSN